MQQAEADHYDTEAVRDVVRTSMSANERLYEAYNELHGLAQDFQKPFDAPAILVVGHQTDGKSALIEALMGFQFNHVGGGTKTRRPITLHMKYDASAVQPNCCLVTDDDGDKEVTLDELRVGACSGQQAHWQYVALQYLNHRT